MKNLIIHKPNQLIEIEGQPITTQGLLTYNFLLHKFQSLKTDNFIISPNEIFENIDMLNNHQELYTYLDSLQNVRVVSKDAKGRTWGAFNLLSEFKKLDNGYFVAIPPTIFKALCGKQEEKTLYYTTIELLEQKAFSCSYSIIFYEIFKKYEKVNIPIFSVSELKEITGTQEKYPAYYDFKRYVILKSLEEINRFDSKYQYSFEEKKLSRKVNEIQFIRFDKVIEPQILETDNEIFMSNKLINTIKRAKKSIFINKVFSQKAINKLLKKYDEDLIILALKECAKYNQEIKSFMALMTAKIEDILNSSNDALDKKLEKNKPIPQEQPQEQQNTFKIDDFKKLEEYTRLKIEEKALECIVKAKQITIEFMLNLKENNENFYLDLLTPYIKELMTDENNTKRY